MCYTKFTCKLEGYREFQSNFKKHNGQINNSLCFNRLWELLTKYVRLFCIFYTPLPPVTLCDVWCSHPMQNYVMLYNLSIFQYKYFSTRKVPILGLSICIEHWSSIFKCSRSRDVQSCSVHIAQII